MSQTEKPFNHVFVALGSNLEDPVFHIRKASHELNEIPDTAVTKYSSLYKSAPVGRCDQPDFINAVVKIKTALQPLELLDALLKIEQLHGRVRELNNSLNAPRTLDLDILLYNHLQLNNENLIIPHPRMLQRAFVLFPLIEIAPGCEIPGHGKIERYISACSDQRIEKLNIFLK